MRSKKVIKIPDAAFPVWKFGAIIKEHRKQKGLTQTELAEKIGVFRNTISNWEADRVTPDFESLSALCVQLDISKEELFGLQNASDITEDGIKLLKVFYDLSPTSQRMLIKTAFGMLQVESEEEGEKICASFIPIEDDLQPCAAGEDEPYSDNKSDAIFIRKTKDSLRADFIAHVKGKSMEPVYHDGDRVYCRSSSAALPGQDVVCTTSKGKLIKRIGEDGTLLSVNPDPQYIVGKKYDDDDVRIRGIVIGIVKPSDFPNEQESITLNELRREDLNEFREEHGIIDMR